MPAVLDRLSFLIEEPADLYHARSGEYLTSHLLGDFRRCPLLYHRKRAGLIEDADSSAFLVGRALHTLVLEGRDRFENDFAFGGPINPRTGNPYGSNAKAFAEWSAAQGKPVLTDAQLALVETLAASVRNHNAAMGLLSSGLAERVARCKYQGAQCQIRIDWLNPMLGEIAKGGSPGAIVDLKTCDDLGWFEPDARRLSYAHQLAFYRSVLHAGFVAHCDASIQPHDIPVYLIAVEKKEPYRCGVWLVGQDVLAVAQRENEAAIERLRQCEQRNYWPTDYESIRMFDHL